MSHASDDEAAKLADRVETARRHAARYNDTEGPKTPYDCRVCRNKELIAMVEETTGKEYYSVCGCKSARQAEANMRKSGLSRVVREMTFDSFRPAEGWQGTMLGKARKYVQGVLDGRRDWFFAGGQPGSGKTHICTAICGELLKAGKAVRYMIWTSEAQRIKANRMDDEAMAEMLAPLVDADVLYIDDLFKGIKQEFGRLCPTDADLRLCFEIINTRVVRQVPTIISCEWSLVNDLMGADEGLFSRVYQMAKPYLIEIGRDRAKNYRLQEDGTYGQNEP